MQNYRCEPNNLPGVSNELYHAVGNSEWSVGKDGGDLAAGKSVGQPRASGLPNRQVLNGILFVLRSGCQWKGLKKEWFGASSSLHARFQTLERSWCVEESVSSDDEVLS